MQGGSMGWRGILMLLMLSLTLVSCGDAGSGGGGGGGGTTGGGGGGTTGGGGGGTQFAAATANDLANHAFAFPNGLSQTLATRYGLPAGQAFTLQFGPFTGATAPFTLVSGGQTAT